MYRITQSIWLGRFAGPSREPALLECGITHILNVGEAESVLVASEAGFREIAWQPIVDLARIPDETAAACLGTLHRMVCQIDARVYVHCIAGQNRSPTVVWLYLIACGLPPDRAKSIIEMRARDAVPGHSKLVDNRLLNAVRQLGLQSFLPHPIPEVLSPPE